MYDVFIKFSLVSTKNSKVNKLDRNDNNQNDDVTFKRKSTDEINANKPKKLKSFDIPKGTSNIDDKKNLNKTIDDNLSDKDNKSNKLI